MKPEHIQERIQAIQQEIGVLPRTVRALLLTDGSVTTLLEAITDDTVQVRTLLQEVIPADGPVAAELGIEPGDPLNHRVVELYARRSGAILIYAVSDTPVNRLDPRFREDLMKADIPIGKILRSHRLETRREIVEVRLHSKDRRLAGIFGISPDEPVISRRYHIIHRELPLIAIEEMYP
ncbi:MAG: chorismate pyruvate-lyase family protein, partial [Methanoregulaceae archaeon]|nr:chorismate pyruvate-lyase family protein [Methanoregulaceae archaeon]